MSEEKFAVLLVEDDEHDIMAIKTIWSKLALEHSLEVIRDGVECVEFFENGGAGARPPSLIIMDIKLPRMDGIELLSWLKQRDAVKHVPVVMLTSSERKEDIVACYENGAGAYLVKPVGIKELTGLVERALAFWSMNRPVPPEVCDGE